MIEPFNIPYDWQDKLSIDPGLKNPLSCHWYAVDYDGNVYVVAEHYDREKDISYHADCIHKICERLNWHTLPNGNIEALIDSAANQTTLASTRSVADLFYDYGISVNTNVNKDLFSGINRVKSYLCDANGNRKLFIFSTCTNKGNERLFVGQRRPPNQARRSLNGRTALLHNVATRKSPRQACRE